MKRRKKINKRRVGRPKCTCPKYMEDGSKRERGEHYITCPVIMTDKVRAYIGL